MSETLLPVPDGLKRCLTCGEFEGIGLYLSPPNRTEWHTITVTCICQGGVCNQCGSVTHRPVSNYYDGREDRVWHVPYFHGWAPCRRCGAVDWEWTKS